MAVAQGYGKTVTSGSVFAYDTGDTRNSYIGEPTVNAIPNADTMTSWTTYYRTVALSTFITEFGTTGYRFVNQPTWNGIYRIFNLGSSGFYTFSAWFRYNGGSAANNGATVYIANYGGGDTLAALDKNLIGVWQRVSFTVNVTSPSNVYFYLISYGGTDNGTGNPDFSSWEVTMPQIELNSHATPFVNGTRSATQGLLPLVGTSTLDLSNVSFDSNAQMTFDGTDDTLDLGIPVTTLAALSNFSMECVVKIDNYPSAASPNGYGSTTKKGVLLGATYYSGVAFYWAGNSSGTACNVHAYIRGADAQRATGTYNLTPGSYHHLMLVNDRSNTTLSLYANGALISQVAGPSQEYNATLIPNAGNIGISKAQVDGGGTDVYSYLPVNVPVTKIYTRALSAGEVRQNYLHYKTRFNLS